MEKTQCLRQGYNTCICFDSGYAHGLIFNILHKAVHGPLVNDFITSLAVHLLEVSLTFPQTEYSGKEVAVSKPWLMIHEPVDLKFDSWFPTDWLSANLRHTVTAIFSHPSSLTSTAVTPGGTVEGTRRTRGRSRNVTPSEAALTTVPQSMEIDQLSDGKKLFSHCGYLPKQVGKEGVIIDHEWSIENVWTWSWLWFEKWIPTTFNQIWS